MSVTAKVKRKLSYKFNDFLFASGLRRNDPSKAAAQSVVIVYHGVDSTGNTAFNSRFISKDLFQKHISYFVQNFNVISTDQLFNEEVSKKKLNVCITFDDGYLNNYTNAYPVLKKYNVPATFFVTTIRKTGEDCLWTDHLDLSLYLRQEDLDFEGERYTKAKHNQFVSKKAGETLKQKAKFSSYAFKEKLVKALGNDFKTDVSLKEYWQLMDENQVWEIANENLFTIGSHGLLHNNLDTLSAAEAEAELTESRKYLREVTGKDITDLAYPDGAYSNELIDLAEKCGYKNQFLLEYNDASEKSDPRTVDRFGINPHCSWNNQIYCLLKNKYF